ncbi:PRC-barrel domain-containing protein [Methanosphaera sp. BMS]|uniref:PRC-barrel domain-containing protein n=1 Tax=Methanosphaera sp. BMS TaxID=1789762 RepID=UPI000DC1E163|nr:PRC-barrel domain-containing protein [Methanosphaera sp. BMS]AWX33538.1 hypothetical protein AW729_10730 [Methanosphaera sp. BMS]
MRIINDIINKEVVNGEAMTIGKVVDIEIDTAANAIESLIIVKNKGRRKSSEEIKIPFEEVSRIGDMILIRKSFEKSFI